MSVVEVVTAEAAHIISIAPRARSADCRELWASARITPAAAMELGMLASTRAWTGLIYGWPVCMFGVAPVSIVGGVGAPWMIGTDLVERHQFAFLRHCRPRVQEMLSMYDRLVNYVDDRNTKAIRWLRWLGFTIGPAEPRGPDGVMFRQFEMTREGTECARHFS